MDEVPGDGWAREQLNGLLVDADPGQHTKFDHNRQPTRLLLSLTCHFHELRKVKGDKR